MSEENNLGCMDKVTHEFDELCCKPKARCFKGLAILAGIYCLACALMLMIIPPVVNAHGYDEGSSVDINLSNMKLSTSILLATFFAISALNVLLWRCYAKREERHESILNGDLTGQQNFR